MHRVVQRIDKAELDRDHLTFDQILIRFRDAWRDFFAALDGGLQPTDLSLRHAEVDFLSPIAVGELIVDVRVRSIGHRSVVIHFEARQGSQKATLLGVFVKVDQAAQAPVRFTAEQADALGAHIG